MPMFHLPCQAKHSPLHDIDQLSDRKHRPDQHAEVHVERDEFTQCQLAADYQIGAVAKTD